MNYIKTYEQYNNDIYLYHLTTYDRYLNIMKEGLHPKFSQQSKITGGGVYLADDLYTAENYKGFYDFNTKMVIIKIKLSDLDPEYIRPDDYELQDYLRENDTIYDNWNQVPWKLSLKWCNQIQYIKTIEPKYITLEKEFINN